MQSVHAQLERPRSLTDLAEERIRSLIVSGAFSLGEQLSEAQLATRLGISKTPVREALLRLRVDGLIDIQPQRGTFVFSLAPEQVDEICQYRELVEVAALGLAMDARLDELVAALDANVAAMQRAHDKGDRRAIPLLDQAFHQAIVDHCDNAYLKQAYLLVSSKISALRSRLPEDDDRVDHCQENHAGIVRLVRTGRVADAQHSLALHIRDTRDSYLAASGNASAAETAAVATAARRRA